MEAAAWAWALLNPFGLRVYELVGIIVAMQLGGLLTDAAVGAAMHAARVPPLPSRRARISPQLQPALDARSALFLAINAVHELVFVTNLAYFALRSPLADRGARSLGLANSACALAAIFVVQDVVYAPVHMLMHWRPLYAHVHKHHHRMVYPMRGFADAVNVHPVEQCLGVACSWAGLYAAALSTGVHASAVGVFIAAQTVLSALNHSGHDARFTLLPGLVDYSVRAHESHHRLGRCNYAQFVMAVDRAMGTYRGYSVAGAEGEAEGEAEGAASKRA